MTDLQKLKNLNLLEKMGWFAKKNPKKALISAFSIFLTFVFILSIPGIVSLSQTHTAEKYITQSELRLDKVNTNIYGISNRLDKNARLYKELDSYKGDLNNNLDNYETLVLELDTIKKQFENKEIKKVLYQFKADKDEHRVLFSDKITDIENTVGVLDIDTTDVVNIDNYLVSQYETFIQYKNSIDGKLSARYDKLDIIKEKGKTNSVKSKANNYFTTISNNKTTFINGLNSLKTYTKEDQGKYTLSELKELKNQYLNQTTLLNNSDSALSTFDGYWAELNEQYYTVVVNQYSNRSTDYVTESNPAYREWTETETYQDTETYTERVYAGSRVVGDTREDIYETVTKTRPVTRTRTVYKNNGQPRTISVPYDVYSYYYTIEKHTPNGTTKDNVYVGKKHEKYDFSIRSWSYKSDEQVGYVVWKQLWNDNAGILRGKNISPTLE